MNCSKCGNPASLDARFCEHCGATLAIADSGFSAVDVLKPEPALDAPLGGRLNRLGAQITDNVLLFLCFVPMLLNQSGGSEELKLGPAAVVSGLLFVGLIIYQLVLLTTRGQTIGKRLLGVRIVRLDDAGNPGFLKAVVLRSWLPAFLYSIPLLGSFIALVDILFIFRSDRRCLHDMIAGTRVVRA